MESDKTTPTLEEVDFIVKLTSEYEDDELVEKMIKSEIEYFTIYKILRDNKDLISKDELDMFCKKTIKRMKKEKIFFYITKLAKTNKYILIFQKAMHGFDVEHLQEYLNTHLLKKETFKLYFKKVYDVSFMEALQKSDIRNFKFSYDAESQNNLIDSDFASPLYFLTKMLGSSITISVNNKDELLENKKLLTFFEKAAECGLLESCKIKKLGSQKEIKSSDNGLELNYTTKHKIDNLHAANSFFEEAYEKKEKTLLEKVI